MCYLVKETRNVKSDFFFWNKKNIYSLLLNCHLLIVVNFQWENFSVLGSLCDWFSVFFVCESVEKAKHNVVKADILHQILPEDLFWKMVSDLILI